MKIPRLQFETFQFSRSAVRPRSKASCTICRAQSKMKIQGSLVKGRKKVLLKVLRYAFSFLPQFLS